MVADHSLQGLGWVAGGGPFGIQTWLKRLHTHRCTHTHTFHNINPTEI
jgi:hypothetical protein